MKNQGLIVASAAAALAVAYAFYDFKSSEIEAENKQEQAQIFKVSSEQVNEVFIEAKDSLRLKNDGGEWKLIEPYQELANKNAVKTLIEDLLSEKSNEVVAEGGQIDWKVFGLEKPSMKLQVSTQDGKKVSVEISSIQNFQSESYLRFPNEQKVHLVSTRWKDFANKKLFDFRDKRLMRFPMDQVVELSITKSGQKFNLKKNESKWIAPNFPSLDLDQDKVDTVIRFLNFADIQNIEKEKDLKAVKLKDFNLEVPEMTVEAKFKDGKSWTSHWGPVKGDERKDYFVKTSEPPMILRFSGPDAKKFLAANSSGLRNRKFAFAFNRSDVSKTDLILPLVQKQLQLKENKWELVGESKEGEIDQDKMKSLLSKLNNLEVGKFKDELPGLDSKLDREVLLKKENGELVFKLSLGAQRKLKIDGVEKQFIVAKTNLLADFIALDETAVKNLSLEEIVKKKTEPSVQNPILGDLPKTNK